MTNLDKIAAKHNLTVSSLFVPFSRSRNKDSKEKSLNWKVTLKIGKCEVIATDYQAGIGHCPAYKNPPKFDKGAVDRYTQHLRISTECETGFVSKLNEHNIFHKKGAPILPNATDVIYSLVLDTNVLDCSNFANWCDELGFNSDSIKDKAIYDDCLEIALIIRSGLGANILAELQLAAQDC